MEPSEIESGTTVYFKIGTGTVFKGEVVGRDKLKKHFAQFNSKDNLVKVSIDQKTTPSDTDTPKHVAPKEFQPDSVKQSDSFFRDSYTIDTNIQHYRLTSENLIKILN